MISIEEIMEGYGINERDYERLEKVINEFSLEMDSQIEEYRCISIKTLIDGLNEVYKAICDDRDRQLDFDKTPRIVGSIMEEDNYIYVLYLDTYLVYKEQYVAINYEEDCFDIIDRPNNMNKIDSILLA